MVNGADIPSPTVVKTTEIAQALKRAPELVGARN
ncbi:MAG: hypothetical protein JWR58_327 [Pseudonocardia sp.]|jgi:hypothetical protein|nr:hypothetical protein [Pseudonocardia sp.]